jgi:hypothetical protein
MPTVGNESWDWDRVAAEVERRRVECGFRRQEDAADAGGIGVEAWRDIENSRKTRYRRTTLASVARALEWPADAVEAIAQGASVPAAKPIEDRIANLEHRFNELESKVTEILERLPGDRGSG